MSYIYLASPYSDPDPAVRQERYEAVCAHTIYLLTIKKVIVFSPIVYTHEIVKKFDMPFEAKDWKHYNESMLRCASSLEILLLRGWPYSKGIKAECAFAEEAKIAVSYEAPRLADGKPLYVKTI